MNLNTCILWIWLPCVENFQKHEIELKMHDENGEGENKKVN